MLSTLVIITKNVTDAFNKKGGVYFARVYKETFTAFEKQLKVHKPVT